MKKNNDAGNCKTDEIVGCQRNDGHPKKLIRLQGSIYLSIKTSANWSDVGELLNHASPNNVALDLCCIWSVMKYQIDSRKSKTDKMLNVILAISAYWAINGLDAT